MMCQRCGVRPANISFTKIVNGEKSEAKLCQQCAAEVGEFSFGTGMGMSFQNFLSGLLNQNLWGHSLVPDETSCTNCGLTYNRFRQSGRFGCARCYDAFDEELDQLLRRIQAGTLHKGKTPHQDAQVSKLSELERLQAELKKAVEVEDYERAAELRDAIQALKKEGGL
ncbi:MAG: hypothetical protein GX058_04760 [Firmicutes bacterium]|nr:hypothetical protein [Bacillota bacterium]